MATTSTTRRAMDTVDIAAAFMAAVVTYRATYWSREYLRLPAIEADRRCDDIAGLRWFKATAGGKRAVLMLLDRHWPETRGLPERSRFIRAVRESALGCLR